MLLVNRLSPGSVRAAHGGMDGGQSDEIAIWRERSVSEDNPEVRA